jgi:hypothetical protein
MGVDVSAFGCCAVPGFRFAECGAVAAVATLFETFFTLIPRPSSWRNAAQARRNPWHGCLVA